MFDINRDPYKQYDDNNEGEKVEGDGARPMLVDIDIAQSAYANARK